jgi:hypothetical protein
MPSSDVYLATPDCTTQPPAIGLVYSTATNGCGATLTAVESVTPDPRASVFTGSPGSCNPVAVGNAYVAGSVVPPESFPALATANVGSGRLRVPSYVDPAGNALAWRPGPGEFFDTALGTACNPYAFRDGVRCVPNTGVWSPETYFSDPQCTMPLVAVPTSPDPCGPNPSDVALLTITQCPPTTAAFRVGAAFTPGIVYQLQTSGACMPAGSGLPGRTYASAIPFDDTIWAPVARTTL